MQMIAELHAHGFHPALPGSTFATLLVVCLCTTPGYENGLAMCGVIKWLAARRVSQEAHMDTMLLHRYTPGSGKALAVVLAMRGGMADSIRRRMHWTDRLALNVVGGLVLPLTVAGEEQKVRPCHCHVSTPRRCASPVAGNSGLPLQMPGIGLWWVQPHTPDLCATNDPEWLVRKEPCRHIDRRSNARAVPGVEGGGGAPEGARGG
jgi:hypothetical protein